MSSQEVIDFIQSKISQRDENGELRLLSSIVEEVSARVEEKRVSGLHSQGFVFGPELRPELGSILNYRLMPNPD